MPQMPEGLPDLGALKVSKDRRDAVLQDQLRQLGLVCVCGNRIRSNGVQVLFIADAMMPTHDGRVEPALRVGSAAFCGEDCPEFRASVQNPEAVVKRPIDTAIWLDEIPKD
jgi:hypothetical protein